MKTKKLILKLLLSIFVAMAMHDLIVGYIDSDTQTELYMHKIEKIALCDASVLHELIHQVLMNTDHSNSTLIHELHIKNWVSYDVSNIFSSLLQYKLYRPPIV